MSLDLSAELARACQIVQEAGQLAREYFDACHGEKGHPSGRSDLANLAIQWKDGGEPVTIADRAVSDLCVRRLRCEFAADAVLSEEIPDDGSRRRAARTWLVDPIDGTKDFIAGRSGYSVMIGLLIDGNPALGVVYQPARERLFYAALSQGAFLREGINRNSPPRRLHVSQVKRLSEARMVSSASMREPALAEVRHQAGIADVRFASSSNAIWRR